ncbi:MAG: hypothetical protein JO284_14685, partial [Planctomycetaceae bacterium]|nr:hypothetical protein [Planctomycetaceae bacterium]
MSPPEAWSSRRRSGHHPADVVPDHRIPREHLRLAVRGAEEWPFSQTGSVPSGECCSPSSSLHPGLVRNRASIDNAHGQNRQQQAPSRQPADRVVGFIRDSGGPQRFGTVRFPCSTRNCTVKIAVIGTGYVGLVTGTCLAE